MKSLLKPTTKMFLFFDEECESIQMAWYIGGGGIFNNAPTIRRRETVVQD